MYAIWTCSPCSLQVCYSPFSLHDILRIHTYTQKTGYSLQKACKTREDLHTNFTRWSDSDVVLSPVYTRDYTVSLQFVTFWTLNFHLSSDYYRELNVCLDLGEIRQRCARVWEIVGNLCQESLIHDCSANKFTISETETSIFFIFPFQHQVKANVWKILQYG